MQGVLQQIVSGLATGGVYASLALALVLIYRSMEALNFAQGEMAMFSTFIAWELVAVVHLNYYAAFAITIAVSIVGGFVLERVVIRPVEKAPPLTVVLVTLGLFFVVNGLAGLIWSYVIKPFPGPPGFPQAPVSFGGVSLGIQDLFLIGMTVVLLAILYLFFQYTKLGLAMRAAALYPETSRLLGVRTSQMLALGWGLAAGVGAVSGMLIAPIEFLDPNMMQPILLYAFAAAVLGGIENPVGAVVGGFLVGVMLALIGTYVPGARDLRLAFGLVIIVAVLIVRPGGLFGRAHVVRV
ncbi:MAG TPA: branched-chain amino acid ABC transporter permease [Terriglobales bacterium]|nr:branched-chain amino acid ABC transporter permease [Terriglobales bacterium]